MSDKRLGQLLAAAIQQYPFIEQYKPVVVPGTGGDYAETWPVGEPGAADAPRPASIPMDRTGVEVMRPDQFGPSDLAAEFLHVDPFANASRTILARLLSPGQTQTLQRGSGDYGSSIQRGLPPARAMDNAVDSAMRGYTVGQWPAEANAQMQYTPPQTQLLDNLKQYMRQGYYPSNYKLPGR